MNGRQRYENKYKYTFETSASRENIRVIFVTQRDSYFEKKSAIPDGARYSLPSSNDRLQVALNKPEIMRTCNKYDYF